MESEYNLREKVGRRLHRRKRDPSRKASLDIPERFKHGEDAEDDVTAPTTREGQYMYQSVFGLIGKVASQAEFNSQIREESSDDEDGAKGGKSERKDNLDVLKGRQSVSPEATRKPSGHRRLLSDSKLAMSLPKLRLKPRSRESEEADNDRMSSSQILSRPSEPQTVEPLRPDVIARDTRLGVGAGSDPADQGLDGLSEEDRTQGASQLGGPLESLPQKLAAIFQFDSVEEVISEYPCWLLQSVLLRGYLYITQKHVCFYAYMPKKDSKVVKSGYLSKKGRSKYNRRWFVLKGDVLTYYSNASDVYFPRRFIDLRQAISATITESKDRGKEATSFTLKTREGSHKLKADTAQVAKDWVKQLQKVIFRSHNDGDSVKISIPLDNIVDIEETPVLDFAETIKIRVVDDTDETYALDEYYFSFFGSSQTAQSGKEALRLLRLMAGQSDASPSGDTFETKTPPGIARGRSPALDGTDRESSDRRRSEGVRSTLVPLPANDRRPSVSPGLSPRMSVDVKRSSFDARRSLDAGRSLDVSREPSRSSFDRGRRSISKSRSVSLSAARTGKSPLSPVQRSSPESVTNSMDRETESSAALQSIEESNASASQILTRSDVFQRPTITKAHTSDSWLEGRKRGSQDTARSLGARVLSQGQDPKPPTRTVSSGSKLTVESTVPDGRKSSESTSAFYYPWQKASELAGHFRKGSKQMSSLLATDSMGYVEKVSGMWAGKTRHYNTTNELLTDDHVRGMEDEEKAAKDQESFRSHFAFGEGEELHVSYFTSLHRVIPTYGKIYISNRHFCFRSLIDVPGFARTKMVLPLKDIEDVEEDKGYRIRGYGLVIVIRGRDELFFEFRDAVTRDDCAITMKQKLEQLRYMGESALIPEDEVIQAEVAKEEKEMLDQDMEQKRAEAGLGISQDIGDIDKHAPPIFFDDGRASIIDFKPTESLNITCLTIGTRGDVQPYIALCKGLLKEGHKPTLATHPEYEAWIRKHGIEFKPVAGDPAELMRLCVENGMLSFSFLKEATTKFSGWIEELLMTAWEACKGADVLIESPSAFAGIHIAEALQIPYFRAFSMPWTRTRAFPQAFLIPEHRMGGAYNYLSYSLWETVNWKGTASTINKWRRKTLGLNSTSLARLQADKVPFLYNYSPSVVYPPYDYADWIHITGYWFLDEGGDWTPPDDLKNFIKRARDDKKKIVYIGFGSIVVENSKALTKSVVDAVLKADVRCILSKGWSDRLDKKDASVPEVPLPPEVFQIKSAPHDWLFKQIDAAVHHGGCGTTGASLRAGIPTIIKPFFADQFFFGSRVETLGVGLQLKKANTTVFARALWVATQDQRMIDKAAYLGEKIRKEDGVGTAIKTIYRELDRARTLVRLRAKIPHEEANEDIEESWTMVDDESDPELGRRSAEFETMMLREQAGHTARALGSALLKVGGNAKGKAPM